MFTKFKWKIKFQNKRTPQLVCFGIALSSIVAFSAKYFISNYEAETGLKLGNKSLILSFDFPRSVIVAISMV